jgi:cytosine/adenosine deaminase-related metal-dependent hydrolase
MPVVQTADLLVHDAELLATVDDGRREIAGGWIAVTDGVVSALGGPADPQPAATRRVDARGCLVTPGLVNTHHHLYQNLTRAYAPALTGGLFDWLVTLYPLWARLDEEAAYVSAYVGLAELALSGCTTSTDHHYVFPHGSADLLGVTIEAAGTIGLRFHPCRGSMDLGQSAGGLPPDPVVEDTDAALAATAEAIERYSDPAPGAMVRVAVAPCSPFSVTERLMTGSATLARAHGVRLHTHLAETREEDAFCRETFGCSPLQYAERLGWLGDDVWFAHGVHFSAADAARLGQTGTGVAHCPGSNARLGAGIAPLRELLDAGAPVGLGVDGAASHEGGHLGGELRQALFAARQRGGAAALTARECLALGTMGGARCLGRADEIGSIEVGKFADLALWRLNGLGHVGVADPVAALVFCPPPPLALLLVGGRSVVEDGHLHTAD